MIVSPEVLAKADILTCLAVIARRTTRLLRKTPRYMFFGPYDKDI